LTELPLPFKSGEIDEVHAYHVLEHLRQQGDYQGFFADFSEYHRILKPDGLFFGIVPSWNDPWAWGDPSHRRVITLGSLVFLSQAEYEKQVGYTAMSDFRFCYKADFETLWTQESQGETRFILKAVK
jgi:SAM-dependent methyltransferase